MNEMARNSIPLEKKIENAQQKVVRTKEKYDAAIDELKKLMDKRDALKKEELIAAIGRSNKSYDEIMEFINSDVLEKG
jgi:uncharacterized coiled-coil DUF342 family protein